MVIKRRRMQEMERDDPQRRDIREILLEAYQQAGDVKGAAASLGMSHPTFCAWVSELGGEIRYSLEFPVNDREPAEAA
jgi:hypothetical protein